MDAPDAERQIRAIAACPTDLSPGDTAARAFQKIGKACLEQIIANAELLRTRDSMRALHQTRVGLRRLRAALILFRPLAQDADLEAISVETRWLAQALDTARDLDIFIRDTFYVAHAACPDQDACARLGARLLAARADAYAKVRRTVRSHRFRTLMSGTEAWLDAGAWVHGGQVVTLRQPSATHFAAMQLDRLRARVLKTGRHMASLDAEDLHKLRIRAKKLRYAAEFFTPLFGGRHAGRQRRLLSSVTDIQDYLGRLNDITVAEQMAFDLVWGQPLDIAIAARQIIAERQGEIRPSVKAAKKAFDRLKAAGRFWR